MMNNTKTIVCHSGAIRLGPGFSCTSVSEGVMAIFVFVNLFAIQNSSCPAVAMRELRSAGPESYGTAHVRAGPGAFCCKTNGGLKPATTKRIAATGGVKHGEEGGT